MITVGTIGYGMIGRLHLATLRAMKNVRVAHIVDARPEAFEGTADGNLGVTDGGDLSGIDCHGDIDRLLEDANVDAVVLCTPTPLHKSQTIRALRAGKHVICEKPLALDPNDVREMTRVARETGKRLFGGFCIRFWPAYEHLFRAVRDGRYGALASVEFRRISPAPRWSAGNWILTGARSGGAMGDLHIHDLDFATYLLGRPKRVFSAGRTVFSGEPDIVYTLLAFDDIPVSCHGTIAHAGDFTMRYRAFFERGVLDFAVEDKPPLVFRPYDKKEVETVEVADRSGHVQEMHRFIEAIEADAPLEQLTYESMVLSAEVYAAARRSVDTGETVTL